MNYEGTMELSGAFCEGVDGAGGLEMTSARNPGKNRSILSKVADHKVRCLSSRWSSGDGGTKISAAFMTRMTFLSDSGTASYCPMVNELLKNETIHIYVPVGPSCRYS